MQNYELRPSDSCESEIPDAEEIDEVFRPNNVNDSSWHKAKKCCKIYCITSMISLVLGLIIFIIVMGIALSNLTEGKCRLLFARLK